jgi:cytochrome c-type biogenesis protein CcmE
MSLCYDFEKWTIITLASIAISLTVGLVLNATEAHEQTLFVTPGHVVFKHEHGKIEVR